MYPTSWQTFRLLQNKRVAQTVKKRQFSHTILLFWSFRLHVQRKFYFKHNWRYFQLNLSAAFIEHCPGIMLCTTSFHLIIFIQTPYSRIKASQKNFEHNFVALNKKPLEMFWNQSTVIVPTKLKLYVQENISGSKHFIQPCNYGQPSQYCTHEHINLGID